MDTALIIGAKGMLGMKFVSRLSERYTVLAYDLPEIDITDYEQTARKVEALAPNIIVNCAAYTAVDAAENDEARAFKVNRDGILNIARAAKTINAPVAHFSTDYVFDGTKNAPYVEDDATNPINVYGASKLAGEIALKETWEKHFIVRITWLFGEHGKNFPLTMLNLAKEKNEARVVSDQYGSPTYTEDVVKQVEALIATERYGVYHASAENVCSWYDVAKYVFEVARLPVTVVPISSQAFASKTARPLYSYLENRNLNALGLNVMPDWKDGVKRFVTGIVG